MRKNQLGKKEGRKRKNEREIEKYAGGGGILICWKNLTALFSVHFLRFSSNLNIWLLNLEVMSIYFV